mmetsp:Transcript_1854/g.7753  ORF Transcript_1854/g.7753 Transcript_1854/m.7753 type:complete len:229 (+) Transcript_1854:21-707(+)
MKTTPLLVGERVEVLEGSRATAGAGGRERIFASRGGRRCKGETVLRVFFLLHRRTTAGRGRGSTLRRVPFRELPPKLETEEDGRLGVPQVRAKRRHPSSLTLRPPIQPRHPPPPVQVQGDPRRGHALVAQLPVRRLELGELLGHRLGGVRRESQPRAKAFRSLQPRLQRRILARRRLDPRVGGAQLLLGVADAGLGGGREPHGHRRHIPSRRRRGCGDAGGFDVAPAG